MAEKKARFEGISKRSLQRQRKTQALTRVEWEVARTNLFLKLWQRNLSYDTCLERVNEIYSEAPAPPVARIPMIFRGESEDQ